MENLRTYGRAPFTVAVIHGGPGARGSMAPVAEELARDHGVLEPLQTAMTVDGQVEELKAVLEQHAAHPAVLIGHSWGAWLSFMVTASYPSLVRKLILVGSAPFETRYAREIMKNRLDRLSEDDIEEFECLIEVLQGSPEVDPVALKNIGAIVSKVDNYDPLPIQEHAQEYQPHLYRCVWTEAEQLRKNGTLLAMGRTITCPVTALHGNYDPHPADGVQKPLAAVLNDFRFVLLDKCGHEPWKERQARELFFLTLRNELR